MRQGCFGRFDKEQEECAYCCVAVECYESLHKPELLRTEILAAKSIKEKASRKRVKEVKMIRIFVEYDDEDEECTAIRIAEIIRKHNNIPAVFVKVTQKVVERDL